MTIGIGVTTHNRPEFAEKCLKSILSHCGDIADLILVYNDGSDQRHSGAYERAFKKLPPETVISSPENHGVAYAKNRLLERMLDADCEWVFLCEDDLKILAPQAVTEYVRVCEKHNLHHLSFAHHGPANIEGALEVIDGNIAYYPHSIGAWTIFSRECLEKVGLLDENFHNAWEHVEHELRLTQAGYMPGSAVHRFPDVVGSEYWITEQQGSIEKSSIRPRSDWSDNIRNGLIYWRDNKPETYDLLFGSGTPLEAYAQSIIGE